MQNLNFNAAFEVKFVADTGCFEGYASVFNIIDKVNDKIVKGAFEESLKQFKERGDLPPLLWQHSATDPIGMWEEMYEDDLGLFVKGRLFIDDIKSANEAYKLLKEKVVTGLSIGYRALDSYKDQYSGVRVLTKVDLQEVSLVTFPANDYARVSNVNNSSVIDENRIPTERELETVLRSSGLSRKQAKGIISCGYKSLYAEDREEEDLIKELTKEVMRANELLIRTK